jgi:hypothetical protein
MRELDVCVVEDVAYFAGGIYECVEDDYLEALLAK